MTSLWFFPLCSYPCTENRVPLLHLKFLGRQSWSRMWDLKRLLGDPVGLSGWKGLPTSCLIWALGPTGKVWDLCVGRGVGMAQSRGGSLGCFNWRFSLPRQKEGSTGSSWAHHRSLVAAGSSGQCNVFICRSLSPVRIFPSRTMREGTVWSAYQGVLATGPSLHVTGSKGTLSKRVQRGTAQIVRFSQ